MLTTQPLTTAGSWHPNLPLALTDFDRDVLRACNEEQFASSVFYKFLVLAMVESKSKVRNLLSLTKSVENKGPYDLFVTQKANIEK